MAISLRCTCGHGMLLREEFSGSQIKCPYCGRWLVAEGPRLIALTASTPTPLSFETESASGPTALATGPGDWPTPGEPIAGPKIPESRLWATRVALILGGISIALGLAGAITTRSVGPVLGAILATAGMVPAGAGLMLARTGQLAFLLASLTLCGTISSLALTEPDPLAQLPPDAPGAIDEAILEAAARKNEPASDSAGGLQARVVSVSVEQPTIRNVGSASDLGGSAIWRGPLLVLTVEVRNTTTGQDIGWTDTSARLIDDDGDTYPEADPGARLRAHPGSNERHLAPGAATEVTIAFPVPPPGTTPTHLDLHLDPDNSRADPFRLRLSVPPIR